MCPDRDSNSSPHVQSEVRQKLAVEMICPYEPGKPIREVQRELGLQRIVKLASNENPLGPSPRVIDTLNRDPLELHTYPDYDGWYLRQAIARKLGTPMESIVVGAGSSDLMRLIADVYLDPGTEALVSDICFPVYANAARIEGAKVVTVPLDDELRYDLERMYDALTDRTRVVFLASPNNPTGLEISGGELNAFMEELPPQVLCVLDLAYHEYTDPERRVNPLELLQRHANLVLLHTFSKVYGLAGLRVGYAVAAEDVSAALSRVRIPFTTSTPAQVAGLVALEDTEHTEKSVTLNDAMRRRLARDLGALGLRTYPSGANFVLTDAGVDSDAVFVRMLRRGVIVRPMRDPRLNTCLRITTGTEEQLDLAIGALGEVLAECKSPTPSGRGSG
jgi:histidinol-phosphate aminotransferase